MTNLIIAYTDGACKGNGKQQASAGGYGTHIIYPNGDILNVWGHEDDTTNNRMELMAAICALQRTPADTPLQIWTDSNYVKNGITEWIHGWKAKQWRKADNKPVLNVELWQTLDALTQNRQISWQWVKGHAGHAGNEQADHLANLGVVGSGEEFIANPDAQRTTDTTITTDSTMTHSDDFKTNNHDGDFQDIDDINSALAYQTNHTAFDDTDGLESLGEFTADNSKAPSHADTHKPDFAISPNHRQNPDYEGNTQRADSNFWAILPPPTNRSVPKRELIMDTETTGFNYASGDRIVEVGIIEMIDRKFTGNLLHVYINPNKQMDEEVIKVHGITNEFLANKPTFEQVAKQIYDFMIDTPVIAHNATFDMNFLKMEFDKAGLPDFIDRVQVIDSLEIAKTMFPGQKNSLNALVSRLKIEERDRTFHGALLDSEILADVYLKMTAGQMVIALEDFGNSDDLLTQQGEGLSQYANHLCVSVSDVDGDQAWRATQFKS